jgi:hypothetical protein
MKTHIDLIRTECLSVLLSVYANTRDSSSSLFRRLFKTIVFLRLIFMKFVWLYWRCTIATTLIDINRVLSCYRNLKRKRWILLLTWRRTIWIWTSTRRSTNGTSTLLWVLWIMYFNVTDFIFVVCARDALETEENNIKL